MVGDVNINLDNQTLHHTVEFIQSLESHGLQQHIQVPTHHHGHTLDVLISRDTSTLLTDINLCNDDGDLIRDHYSIECTIEQSTQLQNREIASYRNVKQIDIDQFCKDVSESPTLNNIQGSVNELVDRYNIGLRALLDKHVPIIYIVVTVRRHAQWYTESLRDAKRRRLERLWRHSKEEADLLVYRQQCRSVSMQLTEAKRDYYYTKIEASNNDQKSLFDITKKLLVNQQAATLPTHESNFELANRFSKFFNDTIDTLRRSFRIGANSDVEMEPLASVKLNNLTSATSDEICDVITSCPNKSCQLDPIPTWLLKQCIDQLLPLLTSIINESLTKGEFPNDFKNVIVKPLLKIPILDKDKLKDYRPVSNLHFISKVIEKLVAKRLEEHMSEYSMYDPMQSAYKLVN